MRRLLIIPSNAKIHPEQIVVRDDVVIADRASVDKLIETEGKILIGRYVKAASLRAKEEIIIDDMSEINGDIYCEGNVTLGDLVKVNGHLYCGGNLDIGGNVSISKGFLAKGYIRISSGLPLLWYILLYLMYLLQIGKSKEVEEILKSLEDQIQVKGDYMLVPYDSSIADGKILSKYGIRIGDNAEVYGTIEAKGRVVVGTKAIIHGSIKATGDVYIGQYAFIDGMVQGKFVKVSRGAIVNNGIIANEVKIVRGAQVYGKVITSAGVEFMRDEDMEKDRIEREKLLPNIEELFEQD